MAEFWETAVQLIKEHKEWAVLIAFLISAGESIIGLSLLIPSTAILVTLSTALAAGGVDLVAVWLAAGIGVAVGDWISYGLGYFFEHELNDRWPFKDNQELLQKGHRFFERWGWLSLFLTRFMGPFRSITPLVAGVCEMPKLSFGAASLSSGFLWAAVVLAPGGLGGSWFSVASL